MLHKKDIGKRYFVQINWAAILWLRTSYLWLSIPLSTLRWSGNYSATFRGGERDQGTPSETEVLLKILRNTKALPLLGRSAVTSKNTWKEARTRGEALGRVEGDRSE